MPATTSESRPESINLEILTSDAEANTQSQTLPRADGGKDAWLALAGCFILEGLVWGFPFGFGVFQR